VVCSRALSAAVQEVSGQRPSQIRSGHVVFQLVMSTIEVLAQRWEIGTILDRYWVLTDPDPISNETMIGSFFDDLSAEYGRIIDSKQNRDNVRHLLWLLLDHLRIPEGALLDFGCGPGRSRVQVEATGRSVVGVDLSARMRVIAGASEMSVLTPQELLATQAGSFAGAFASYVLHLDPRPERLGQVIASIEAGGALVANIHKNRGLETLCQHIESEGCSWELLPKPALDVHGSYLAVRDVS
jgi:SAM-dependent methyltransferase